jgi:hypothetical protein
MVEMTNTLIGVLLGILAVVVLLSLVWLLNKIGTFANNRGSTFTKYSRDFFVGIVSGTVLFALDRIIPLLLTLPSIDTSSIYATLVTFGLDVLLFIIFGGILLVVISALFLLGLGVYSITRK